MVVLDTLFKKKKISRIRDIELERYLNFLESSYLDNLRHCETVLDSFSRWSIISGYYAMHDITKLFIVKKLGIKIDFNVHTTTIIVLEELVKNGKMSKLLEKAYEEFLTLASDLDEAKGNRVKVQYYTGSSYSSKIYLDEAREFLEGVKSYIEKIKELMK